MMLSLLVLCSAVSAQTGLHTLTISLAAPADTAPVSVEAVWLGETVQVPLSADGDGLFHAELSGPSARYIQVSLWQDGQAIYSGVERLAEGDQTLSYGLTQNQSVARRMSRPLPQATLERREAAWIGGSLLWTGLTLAGMLWLAGRARRNDVVIRWRWWWSPILWLVLAIAWTWPAATGALTSRHFDALGTIWGLASADRLISGLLQDPLTGWPLGGDYARFDSFLLLPLGLTSVEPTRLHGLLQIAGITMSAWAAERFALAVGARAPWSLLAGLLFAFSGLSANVLLEGHVYMLLDPWLPLMGLLWWRALALEGGAKLGALTGLAFSAALLTSGYLGLSAAVVAIGLWVGAAVRRGREILPATLGALAVVLPVGIAYLWAFVSHSGGLDTSAVSIQMASASLASLAGPSPEIDRQHHSLALAISPVMLALVALAPLLLPRRARWRVLLCSGAVALIIAAGPVVGISPHESWFSLGALSGIRFPVRLVWAVLLCWGALAAWTASVMVQRHGRWVGGVILALALAESFLLVQMPHRQQTQPDGVPSVYAVTSGAILDFYPVEIDERGEMELLLTATDCFYQARHARPIADRCAVTPTAENPRVVLGQWLGAMLLSGRGAEAVAVLEMLGFSAVAVHADLFHPGDLARVEAALTASTRHESRDGGEHIVLFALPAPAHPPRRVLPEAPIPLQIGAEPLARAGSLRIEVLGDAAGAAYTAQVTSQGQTVVIPVTDEGAVAGDLQHDGARVGLWEGAPTGELSVALLRGHETLWQGPVWPGAAADRIVFWLEGDTARPIVAMPAALDRPMTRHNGLAAISGWCGILLVGLLGVLRLEARRD